MATSEMDLTQTAGAAMLERVVLGGDLSKLSSQERMLYYRELCVSLRLNPLTQPFQYLNLSGKLVLYARKDATEQLRKQHGVSITKLEATTTEGVYIVTATAKDQSGREDVATGAVAIENLKGEMKANAMLKAETKAKRRVTLSLCGLGMLDETEVESIPGAQPVDTAWLDEERERAMKEAAAHQPAADAKFDAAEEAGDTQPRMADGNPIASVDRAVLMGKIEACADMLKLKKPDRADLWRRYIGPGYDRETAPVEKMQALLDQLRSVMGKATQEKLA